MIVTDKELFIRFLKENNVYSLYMELSKDYWDRIFTDIDPYQYISCSGFSKGWFWNDTKQGTTYWANLDAEWLCYICDNNEANEKVIQKIKEVVDCTLYVLDYHVKNKMIYIIKKHNSNINH